MSPIFKLDRGMNNNSINSNNTSISGNSNGNNIGNGSVDRSMSMSQEGSFISYHSGQVGSSITNNSNGNSNGGFTSISRDGEVEGRETTAEDEIDEEDIGGRGIGGREGREGEEEEDDENSQRMTQHVVTRWYRAPELILLEPYSLGVDVVSYISLSILSTHLIICF